jgi:ABC-2 type transport system permease protein
MPRILWAIRKEFLQLRRDPRLLAILLVAPVFQLLILGFAARTDVREVRMAVRDEDHTPESREYVRAAQASGYLTALTLSGGAAQEEQALVWSRAALVLVVPRGFGAALAAGRPVVVQVLVDGADSNVAVQGLQYLMGATRLFNARRLGARAAAGITLQPRVWFNPQLESFRYMVPGILGLLLLATTTLVGSMALVKEYEQGTLEQLIVTPLRRWEILGGKLVPLAVVGLLEATLALPMVVFAFGIPLRGSLGLLYLFCVLFLVCSLGLGLLISTLVKTQQQAMLLAAFGVMLPFALLSGFIFPVASMPEPVRAVTPFIPMTHFLVVLRALFLKGAGWGDLWPQAAALLAWGAAVFGLAVGRFQKRLG